MNKPLPAKAKVPLKQRTHNTLVYLRQHWQLYLISWDIPRSRRS